MERTLNMGTTGRTACSARRAIKIQMQNYRKITLSHKNNPIMLQLRLNPYHYAQTKPKCTATPQGKKCPPSGVHCYVICTRESDAPKTICLSTHQLVVYFLNMICIFKSIKL